MDISADESPVPDWEQYRNYLRLIAELQLNPRLRVKCGASDVVQQTMLEAHRDFAGYRGKTESELQAWLKMILTNNLLAVARSYSTRKRSLRCEVAWQDRVENSSAILHRQLVANDTSPSMKVMKQERFEQLAAALLKLLDDERTAVILKHYHDWSVEEISQHLGRSQTAVAGLLRRGLKKIRHQLSESNQ